MTSVRISAHMNGWSRICLSICLLVGYNLTAQSLDSAFSHIGVQNDMMGGSLVLFCENGVIASHEFGTADYGRGIAVTSDTKYRVASISKTVTAIAVMQLVDQGLIDLDENINTYLGYAVSNPHYTSDSITVRMLLSHTSSIIDGPTYSSFLSATYNSTPIPNLNALLQPAGAYYDATQFNQTIPGQYFNYANINYVILGTIVEAVSQLRFDVYCKQNISQPLGLDASFNVSDLQDLNELAVLYRKPGGVWTAQVDDYQGTPLPPGNTIGYLPGTNGGRFAPQGGFRCSAEDLSVLFLCLMNQGTWNGATLLSPAACLQMSSNQWSYNGVNGNPYFGLFRSWGLGMHRITSYPGNDVALSGSQQMFGHTGEAYGLVSDAYFDTIRKVGFVFVTNGVGMGYQSNNQSVFYTVEQDVFNAIEQFGQIDQCAATAGLNEPRRPSILYPNPCENTVFIGGRAPLHNEKLRVYGPEGRFIALVPYDAECECVDVSELKSGLYFLEVRNSLNRFVKE
ncbi:serine hydrolase [Cryomorphaceae bacterium]|nr:serine hydrolase [Cryomorphaceae bacterium]